MLGRRRRKEQQEQEDRDKTLEPDKTSTFNPLMKSATTIMGAISKKERTPYRLNRNYSDRRPTASTSSTTTTNYNSRTDLNSTQHNASSSAAVPKSSYYESPSLRHKDPYYDVYNSRLPTSSRHNDYDHLGLSTSSGSSYGYYEGRDKENTYKSKYEPSRLYAESNNSSDTFGRERHAPHYPKSYRRTATTNYERYHDDLLDTPSTSSGYSSRNISSASRYAPRKSTGYHRSQTQKFFDSEKSSVLRSVNDPNNNTYDAIAAYDDETIKSEAIKEREARRKEIQSLIAKYAQIDDVYLRAIDTEPTTNNNNNNNNNNDTDTARNSIFTDYNDTNKNNLSNSSILDGGKSTVDLFGNSATSNSGVAAATNLGLSHQYARTPSNTSFYPLSKIQSASAISSVNRSRIPKTFSSFVRNQFVLNIQCFLPDEKKKNKQFAFIPLPKTTTTRTIKLRLFINNIYFANSIIL